MNLKASLTRRYGPLSLGVWLIVVAAVILVYRYFRPGTSSNNGSSSADTGALADNTNAGRFIGAGGGDGGLVPSNQTLADSQLTGPGTPVVYDPLTGSTSANDPWFDPGPILSPPPATQDQPDVPGYTPQGVPYTEEYVRNRDVGRARTPPAAAKTPAKKKKPVARPATARGQRAPAAAPELVSEHGQGGGYTPHPVSRASTPPATPTRTTQGVPPVVERPRSSSDSVVTRTTTPVGTTSSAKTYAAMGRKGEVNI